MRMIKVGTMALLVILMVCLVSDAGGGSLFDIIEKVFFERYKDYPQIFKDMAFTLGDWDSLEIILHNEMTNVLYNNYEVYPVGTYVGNSIVHVCDRPKLPGNLYYGFHVINVPGKNAFAIPGGGVYITKPLVDTILSRKNKEDMFAFIFGHEVAHICRRHWITLVKEKYAGEFWQWAAREIARKGNADMLRQIVSVVLKTIFSGYSREHEREADALALKYMERAGYNLQGAVDVLELLKRLEGRRNCLLWCTHPDIEERIGTIIDAKLRSEIELKEEVLKILESCDSTTGIVALSILHPKGYFPTIGLGAHFDEFAAVFFAEKDRRKMEQALLNGSEFSVPMYSYRNPGQYFEKMHTGNYILFYSAESQKRRFTPFSVEDDEWGPVRISVQPKTVTYIEIFPRGENAAVYQWGYSHSEHEIMAEFIKRFVLNEEGEKIYEIDFSPLPNKRPNIKDIEITCTEDVREDHHRLIIPEMGSMVVGKFTVRKGPPTNASLNIKYSIPGALGSNSGYITVTINGKKIVSDYPVTSPNSISRVWDISDFLQGGDNTIVFELTKTGAPVALYHFSIGAKGVGIGTFYKLSYKSQE